MGQWFAEIFVERKRDMIGAWENLDIYLIRTTSPVFASALGYGEYSGLPRPESLASYTVGKNALRCLRPSTPSLLLRGDCRVLSPGEQSGDGVRRRSQQEDLGVAVALVRSA